MGILALLRLFCFLISFYCIVLSQANAATNTSTEDLVTLLRELERRVVSLKSQVKLLKEHKTQHALSLHELDQSVRITNRKMHDSDTIFINMMEVLVLERKQIDLEFQELYALTKKAESRFNNLGHTLKAMNYSTGFEVRKKYCEAVSNCPNMVQVKRQQNTPNNGVIAFTAYLDHAIHDLGPNQALKFNQILLNEGHGYNQFTGVFTVPIGGIYIFSFTVAARDEGNLSAPDIWMKLVVNGEHKATVAAESMKIRDDEMGTNIINLRVDTGDAVWITHHDQGSTRDIFSSDTLRVVTFSGALLYQ
ncbi:hypothetical protein CHS0354_024851 [Potamilus streckersoni]|uniref:C1q domain-containing protein n=1 Tax=Potamilus streckersoni TaxID=2493646 RepID=A0AAE0RQL3_9BIVA|nr:hypothetical protein CHS0354_024851 [Potamilus streckersoni]